jgi:hypothetical protein
VIGNNWFVKNSLGEAIYAPIPNTVANALRGKPFSTFDKLREAIWKEIGKDVNLMKNFNKSNQDLIKAGKAPYAITSQQVGGRKVFELDHIIEIQYGGKVYSLDNLRIATPFWHIKVKGQNIIGF